MRCGCQPPIAAAQSCNRAAGQTGDTGGRRHPCNQPPSQARSPQPPSLAHPRAKAQAATRCGRAWPAFSGASSRSRAAFCSLLPCTRLLWGAAGGAGVGGMSALLVFLDPRAAWTRLQACSSSLCRQASPARPHSILPQAASHRHAPQLLTWGQTLLTLACTAQRKARHRPQHPSVCLTCCPSQACARAATCCVLWSPARSARRPRPPRPRRRTAAARGWQTAVPPAAARQQQQQVVA